MSTAEVLDQALKLTPYERFTIVDSLIQSLDRPDENLNKIWLDEAERRLIAYREGRLKGIPAEEIFGDE